MGAAETEPKLVMGLVFPAEILAGVVAYVVVTFGGETGCEQAALSARSSPRWGKSESKQAFVSVSVRSKFGSWWVLQNL